MTSPGIFVTVLAFALVIGPLVFLHEMGHYWIGRWFGVKAEAFSIGFGHEILGFTDRRGTRWKIGWLPLGGYVRFAGDMNPASQPDAAWLALPAEERNRTFQAKPLWQRALIVAAGPAVNIVIAIVIVGAFAFAYGEVAQPVRILPIVGQTLPGSPAAKAGLREDDRITALDGHRIDSFGMIADYVRDRPGRPLTIDFTRDHHAMSVGLIVGRGSVRDASGQMQIVGRLGMSGGRVDTRPVPLWRAPWIGVKQTAAITQEIATRIGELITGQVSIKELSGPVGTARVAGQQFEVGASAFVALIAMVSINLGFINLLPIPILDGGHLLFYAIEAIRRRPIGPTTVEWAFRGGLAALLALMVFVTINDLAGFGLWKGLAGLIG